MNHYFDIEILGDAEHSTQSLMNQAFNQLHFELVNLKATDIGISFPKLGPKFLGQVLRVHGSQARCSEARSAIAANRKWQGLRDFIAISSVYPIPKEVSHITVRRQQMPMAASKVRRLLSRGSITQKRAEELLEQRPMLTNPYARMRSTSSQQLYRLFIEQGKPLKEPIDGVFNTFGLSSGATVPAF